MKDIERPTLAILKSPELNPNVFDALGAGKKDEVERQKHMIELLESIDKTLKEAKDKLDKNP